MVLVKEKAQRRGAPKVKSGCKTCKIRRVKCDETKPSCKRCTDTGRRCDGYHTVFVFLPAQGQGVGLAAPGESSNVRESSNVQVMSVKKRTSQRYHSSGPARIGAATLLPLQVTEIGLGPQEERHLFTLFRERLAPDLGGGFDTNFWTLDIPRIAQSEPAVYHAIIAITVFGYDEMDEPVSVGPASKVRFFYHYNQAIHFVRSKLHVGQEYQLVILLTCFLFVCLEFRRGNHEAALNHLQSGLGILEFQELVRGVGEIRSHAQTLRDAFSRLSIQGSLVGRPPPCKITDHPSDWSGSMVAFASINEAREFLMNLLTESLKPIGPQFTYEATFSTLRSEQCYRATLISQLHQWNSQLNLFIVNSISKLSLQDLDLLRILRIQSLIAIIWNSTTIPASDVDNIESKFDAYTGIFRTILSLASFLVDDSLSSGLNTTEGTSPASALSTQSNIGITPSPGSTALESHHWPAFCLEMGIIFALYFVAIKCRSPKFRRQANYYLSQLKTTREGMWDATVLVKISQYVIEVEEKSCAERIMEDARTWPSEEARVHGTFIQPWCDYVGRVQKVVFSWRPEGRKGGFLEWEKDIYF